MPPTLQTPTPPRFEHWVAALAATGVAYFVVAIVSLKLAIPPGYATPLFPAAGIALACVLMYGGRMTIGISIASFAASLLMSPQGPQWNPASWTLPAVNAIGASLQALAGAWLIRRFVQPRA